ncbi:ATP synthase F0 subunit B [Pelagibius litoralis]|uniref:ATP synthase F0 subunit B n=1 Tax=Pelagibius litoralis TaxID=374515 RepID=A0A967EUM6_9PROT|nr:ATP synthase F0 subunit B [Pelagibius litoralis]NIA67416.1 ATP synthase F0 subunit B [Pelagibius litoralis]
MFDNKHPWFVPLYRRVLIIAVCFLWLVVESIANQPFWQIISFAVLIYAIWTFLYTYEPPENTSGKQD